MYVFPSSHPVARYLPSGLNFTHHVVFVWDNACVISIPCSFPTLWSNVINRSHSSGPEAGLTLDADACSKRDGKMTVCKWPFRTTVIRWANQRSVWHRFTTSENVFGFWRDLDRTTGAEEEEGTATDAFEVPLLHRWHTTLLRKFRSSSAFASTAEDSEWSISMKGIKNTYLLLWIHPFLSAGIRYLQSWVQIHILNHGDKHQNGVALCFSMWNWTAHQILLGVHWDNRKSGDLGISPFPSRRKPSGDDSQRWKHIIIRLQRWKSHERQISKGHLLGSVSNLEEGAISDIFNDREVPLLHWQPGCRPIVSMSFWRPSASCHKIEMRGVNYKTILRTAGSLNQWPSCREVRASTMDFALRDALLPYTQDFSWAISCWFETVRIQ